MVEEMKVIFNANSPLKIKELNIFIHDSTFDLEKLNFDNINSFIELPIYILDYKRKVNIKQNYKKGHYYVPVISHKLLVSNVISYKVNNDQGIGFYTLNKIKSKKDSIIIYMYEKLRLIVLIRSIDISLLTDDTIAGY